MNLTSASDGETRQSYYRLLLSLSLSLPLFPSGDVLPLTLSVLFEREKRKSQLFQKEGWEDGWEAGKEWSCVVAS